MSATRLTAGSGVPARPEGAGVGSPDFEPVRARGAPECVREMGPGPVSHRVPRPVVLSPHPPGEQLPPRSPDPFAAVAYAVQPDSC